MKACVAMLCLAALAGKLSNHIPEASSAVSTMISTILGFALDFRLQKFCVFSARGLTVLDEGY